MSKHGAALQNYNLELVKCLEDLKTNRKEIQDMMTKEQNEKVVLEKKIGTLQDKLDGVNRNLDDLKGLFQCYERTISETEKGFEKILESSQALLNLVQLEANRLPSCQDTMKHLSVSFAEKSMCKAEV